MPDHVHNSARCFLLGLYHRFPSRKDSHTSREPRSCTAAVLSHHGPCHIHVDIDNEILMLDCGECIPQLEHRFLLKNPGVVLRDDARPGEDVELQGPSEL